MIAISSSSIGYAYQLLFILYRGKPATFCCSFPNLFVYCRRLCCFGLTISATVLTVTRVECELRFSYAIWTYFITNLWFSLAILSNSTCLMLERLAIVFCCAVLVFTSLLFFFRTRAVFDRNTWVTAFFAGLWLAVLGVSLALIVDTLESVPVNSVSKATAVCLRVWSSFYRVAEATTIIALINDTLVFVAITWRLSRNSYDPYTLRSGVKFLIFGDHLPVFSKVLLRDGQAYYLLALLWSVSHAEIAHRLFFPQVHRYHEYHISDYVILFFEPWDSSRNLWGSERHTDECHGLSSIQEYDTVWNLERYRDFYHPNSRDLKTIALWEGESEP